MSVERFDKFAEVVVNVLNTTSTAEEKELALRLVKESFDREVASDDAENKAPTKRGRVRSKRGSIKVAVHEALRHGPKTLSEVVSHTRHKRASVVSALTALAKDGNATHEGGVYSAA